MLSIYDISRCSLLSLPNILISASVEGVGALGNVNESWVVWFKIAESGPEAYNINQVYRKCLSD